MPALAHNLKPVSQITDRAKRYRANSKNNRPDDPKLCGYCGNPENLGVDHIDGNEAHGDKQNLMWACKSCNQKKANLMRKAGIGKLTRQYNPKGSRRQQFQDYGNAIKVMRGEFDGDVGAAMATIKGTPASLRSAYTSRTWGVRKQIYGPSGRANAMKRKKANPKSLEKCVNAVSKKGGAVSPYAVCTAQAKKKAAKRKSKNTAPTTMVTTAFTHSAAGKKAAKAINDLFGKSKKKNPMDASEQMFELFHGLPPTEVLEIVEKVHVHSKLAALGSLTSLKVLTPNGSKEVELTAPDPDNASPSDVVWVAVNEKYSKGGIEIEAGTQIYFMGGDQEIPVDILTGKFGLKADDFKEHMTIGLVTEITYRTRKTFEKDGAEPVDFYHALGKEHSRGVLPMLVYKPRNPSFEWFGGRYKILPYRDDIKASPGIGG